MDNICFGKIMGLLQRQFGEIKKERMPDYFDALEFLTNEQFEKAAKNLIFEFVPTAACLFPVPAQIIKAASLDRQSTTQELIDMLRKTIRAVGGWRSVDFGNLALHSVIDRWGGWDTICDWGQEEWDINEGRFKIALECAIKNDDRGPEYLPGIHEKENGFLSDNYFVRIRRRNGQVVYLSHYKTGEKIEPIKNNRLDNQNAK